MRIGFTGTQKGMTKIQKNLLFEVIALLKPSQFHHGDCIGADYDAHQLINLFNNISIHIHPPSDSIKRAFCSSTFIHSERPYLQRNINIVEESDILIAAPKSDQEELRSGTWTTVRYARKHHKPIIFLYP